MVDITIEEFFEATLAQFLGVSIALLGCLGIWLSKNGKWSSRQKWGIVIPFALAYGTAIAGFVVCGLHIGNTILVRERTYKIFTLLYLYADAILLPIMIYYSGGVKQSLFTPLFFQIPAMAVVFVYGSEVLQIAAITSLTLLLYIIVYWWYWFRKPATDDDLPVPYGVCECLILIFSVALTVVMSLTVTLPTS